jgi:hypothetical protein
VSLSGKTGEKEVAVLESGSAQNWQTSSLRRSGRRLSTGNVFEKSLKELESAKAQKG